MKRDIIKEITEDMVNSINEHGTKWLKNWVGDSSMPINMVSKANYTGFNFFILAGQHRQSGTWATLKQFKKAGIRIKYEEMTKPTPIIYFQMLEDKKDPKKKIPLLRNYRVWNLDQSEDFKPEENESPVKFNHEESEEWVRNTKAVIDHSGNRACYSSVTDKISMPPKESFINTDDATAEQNYYGTLFHELTHWTGEHSRCDRKNDTDILDEKKYQRSDYAFEELVAELGACFLCAEFGLEKTPQPNHAKYINIWLSRLDNDAKLFNKAFELAIQSTDYLKKITKH
jgi:antirestriction protein ArdC